MPKRKSNEAPFIPPIGVTKWIDPVSGNTFYRVKGPFQVTDRYLSLVTPTELIALRDQIDAAMPQAKGGVQ